MSGQIIGELFDAFRAGPYAQLRPNERFVLTVHAENARDRDRTSRGLTAADVAERTTLAVGTVRNILGRLVRAGALEPVHNNTGAPQDYRIPKPPKEPA